MIDAPLGSQSESLVKSNRRQVDNDLMAKASKNRALANKSDHLDFLVINVERR
jgi:hypothetical protein